MTHVGGNSSSSGNNNTNTIGGSSNIRAHHHIDSGNGSSSDKSAAMIRLATLLVAFLMHVGLAVWSSGGAQHSRGIRESVMFGCLTVLGAGLYAGLYALLRRRATGSSLGNKLPLLTIGNIWTYVYGVGTLGFTMLYCISGSNLTCICCVFASLAQICVDDLLLRTDDELAVRVARGVTTALALTAVFLAMFGAHGGITVISDIDGGSIFALVFGVTLPLLAPHFLQALRGAQREDRVISEYIAAAMPLAVVVAATSLVCTASTAEGLQPLTHNLAGTGIALLLMPITGTLILFFLMNTAVTYSVASFVAPAAVVIVGRYFVDDPGNRLVALAMAAAALGFILEAYATRLPTHGWRHSLSSYDVAQSLTDEEESETFVQSGTI